jgi:hypothetical protein
MEAEKNNITELKAKAETFDDIFKKLSAIDVSKYTAKKMSLTYLTWSQAWQFVLENYPNAIYQFEDFDGVPYLQYPDGSAEVRVRVVIEGHERHMWLPCMDNKNNAINQPNSRQTNDSKMRCLVKCLAMFGLGLDVYGAKESIDLEPESIGDIDDALPGPEKDVPLVISEAQLKALKKKIESGNWPLDACKEKWGVNHLADVSQEQYQRIMSKKSEEKANESANS